jgi:hypothetical protein
MCVNPLIGHLEERGSSVPVVSYRQLVSNPVSAFQKSLAGFGQSWRQFADHTLPILYLILLLITLIPGVGRMGNEGCDVCDQVK